MTTSGQDVVKALKKRRDQYLSFPDVIEDIKKKVGELFGSDKEKVKKKKLAGPGK